MADNPKLVMATVYLKSKSGRSLLQDKAPLDAKPYLASPETMDKAIAELRKLGFTIEAQGATVSISGPPELFEEVCGAKISLEERTVAEPQGRSRKQLVFTSAPLIMNVPGLEDAIDGIVVAVPGLLM